MYRIKEERREEVIMDITFFEPVVSVAHQLVVRAYVEHVHQHLCHCAKDRKKWSNNLIINFFERGAKALTFFTYKRQGPREHVHEVGQPIRMRWTVELPDIHHVVLILQHCRLEKSERRFSKLCRKHASHSFSQRWKRYVNKTLFKPCCYKRRGSWARWRWWSTMGSPSSEISGTCGSPHPVPRAP